MKPIYKYKMIGLLLLIAVTVQAQRYNILSGKLKNLEGIKSYNVTFDYTDLQIHGFESEEAYVQHKVDNRIKHGDPDKAERFEKTWRTDRSEKWEPGFIKYFNDVFKEGEISVARNPELKYTMHIQSKWIYPGYGAVVAAEPAKLTAVITVSETANPANVLLVIEFEKLIGFEKSSFVFNLGDRISAAYEKLAKNLTIQLKRFL